ncbi:MAG TPA: hypothetical protein VM076_22575 [Gemmatimonadaceae bacterium]|nr:hypothetical protein [Gemmatimonadaceae bacterium]
MIGIKRTLCIVLAFGAACDRGRDASKADEHEALAATPARPVAPYTARQLTALGRLTGHIELDGAPPPDSVFQPAVDQVVCGTGFTRKGLNTRGNRIANVVVWLDGIRTGKPLPVERRFEIANDRCQLVPELQTVIVGGTLNVRNQDAVEHRMRVTRREGGEVIATIRETDEGQVVPDERVLAKPGVLELSCAVHPWTRGWIAVFDHPYFATSGTDGSFSIDSISPGRYQVRVWHPRLGLSTDSVTIDDGRETSTTIRVKAGR